MPNGNKVDFTRSYPERVCPICGKKFLMMCRPEEWGCWSREGITSRAEENHRRLFCSLPCVNEYDRRVMEAKAEKIKQSVAYHAWEMYMDGMTFTEVARKMGVNPSSVSNMVNPLEARHWKVLEYIMAG